MQNSQRTALITGASAGLGVTFAEHLARAGKYDLVLVARRADRLEIVKKNVDLIWQRAGQKERKVHVIPADLSLEGSRLALLEEVKTSRLDIEILVNNAGFGSYGDFLGCDWANQNDMVIVNCVAPLQLIHAIAPGMKERKSGTILNICSTAAFQPVPWMATYGGTKALLLNFTVALAEELRTSGVIVQALCPGPTHTEFHIVAGVKDKIPVLRSMTPDEVVETSLKHLKRSGIVVPGLQNKAITLASRFLSRSFIAKQVYQTLRRYRPGKGDSYG